MYFVQIQFIIRDTLHTYFFQPIFVLQNQHIIKITTNENDINDILQTFQNICTPSLSCYTLNLWLLQLFQQTFFFGHCRCSWYVHDISQNQRNM